MYRSVLNKINLTQPIFQHMHIKQVFTAVLFLSLPVLAGAQKIVPVNWTFTAQKINDKTWDLQLIATIQPGWHLYAQNGGEVPMATTFKFKPHPLVATTGKVKENGKLKKTYDRNVDAELKYYEQQVSFVQTVTVKGKAATDVKGSVEFVVCNDHECLPTKEVEFKIAVGGK